MQYSHQTQLSEVNELPSALASSVTFWSGNVRHLITAQANSAWSLYENGGTLIGDFLAVESGFAIIDDDGVEVDRFDNWRSAIRRILRRSVRAA